jgi:hypothetical protein
MSAARRGSVGRARHAPDVDREAAYWQTGLHDRPGVPRDRVHLAWIPTEGRGLTNGGESDLFWAVYWERD